MKALGGRGGIAPTHSRPRHWMGVSGQRHAPAALYPRGKDPRYPLYRRLGGPQRRSGHRGYRKNPLPLPGSNPDRPVVQHKLKVNLKCVSCPVHWLVIVKQTRNNRQISKKCNLLDQVLLSPRGRGVLVELVATQHPKVHFSVHQGLPLTLSWDSQMNSLHILTHYLSSVPPLWSSG
jgi:hypothetical protein